MFVISKFQCQVVRAEQIECHKHNHRSPIQNMIGFYLRGHYVEVTQDGDRYNARIDGDNADYGMTESELIRHIDQHVGGA
jgi:hypothetical protein